MDVLPAIRYAVTSDGIRIAYTVVGESGPPIVIPAAE